MCLGWLRGLQRLDSSLLVLMRQKCTFCISICTIAIGQGGNEGSKLHIMEAGKNIYSGGFKVDDILK